MNKRHLTILAGLLAAASFGMPAYADPATPSGYTDGYTLAERDREQGFPARVVTPATPMQQAVLAMSERSRSVSDGYAEGDWEKRQSAELQETMAKRANDPMLDAVFSFYEAQRRALDGRG
ncbi:MAG TPA: hypothetical protein VFP70_01760 [Burkholderiales bacterium]|nr:hypothetical protein [Burkholderiales bacterium]